MHPTLLSQMRSVNEHGLPQRCSCGEGTPRRDTARAIHALLLQAIIKVSTPGACRAAAPGANATGASQPDHDPLPLVISPAQPQPNRVTQPRPFNAQVFTEKWAKALWPSQLFDPEALDAAL